MPQKIKTVLVTGGAGLLGSYVIQGLGNEYEISSFDLQKVKSEVKSFEGNLLDLDDVKQAVQNVDAVIHLAAAANINYASAGKIIDLNVRGTWNVLEASFEAALLN